MTSEELIPNKPNNKKKMLIVAIFATLVMVIVGLVIAIIIISNNGPWSGSSMTDNQMEQNGGEVITDEVITDEGSAACKENMTEEEKAEYEKAEGYRKRAFEIMETDEEMTAGKEVLTYLIDADKIFDSTDSAADVVNAAYSYGDEATAEEYGRILEERLKRDGYVIDDGGARG